MIHRFSPENAREMAFKALEARRKNKEARKLQAEQDKLNQEIMLSKPLNLLDNADKAFIDKRIVRVRKQISKLDEMIDDCVDPKQIDQLASALTRLSELERVLSGRPLPGSRKPAAERPGRRSECQGIANQE